jgi:hypothetical protein
MVAGNICPFIFKFESSSEDKFFNVINENCIIFNTVLSNKCSDAYFLSIIIHEYFHFIKQNLIFKSYVEKLKESLSNPFMVIFDIEADLYAAAYFKYFLNYDLEKFISLLYESRELFGNSEIKLDKLSRFLGTAISITNFYINNKYSVYLPSFTRWVIDNSIGFVIKEGYHHNYYLKKVSLEQLEEIKKLFDINHSISKLEFILGIRKTVTALVDI